MRARVARSELTSLRAAAARIPYMEARVKQAEQNEAIATAKMMQAINEHILEYDDQVWTTETLVLFKMHLQGARDNLTALGQNVGSLLNILESQRVP